LTIINEPSKNVDVDSESVILLEERAQMEEIEQVFSEKGSKVR
jgi:hypothetical protein